MNNYQLIISKNRNKWQYIVLIIITLVLIVISAIVGVKLAEKKYEEYIQNIGNDEIEILLESVEQIEQNQKNENRKLPVVTETGKANMQKIYSSEYKRVFLTFDDGPSSNITPLILDVLKANNIKATFFTLGMRVEQNPHIVKRAYEEGHYVANHGYSHIYSNIYESIENLLDEYNRTENAIRNAIGLPEYSSHLFRFPGGSVGGKYNSVKKEYKKVLDAQGVFYIDWNCLNEDSTGSRTKEQLVGFIKDTSINKNSVVVLMHDAGDKILTYETLQEVINYFVENGYVFENFYNVLEYEYSY